MIIAHYFDGHSARLHTVQLTLRDGVVCLIGAGVAKLYGAEQVRMAEPFATTPCVLDFDDGARCEVAEPRAKVALAKSLNYRPSRVVRWQRHWYAALLALILLGAGLYGGLEWGMPLAAERIVAALPERIDVDIGKQSLAALEARVFKPSRLSEQRIAEVNQIFLGLLPAHPRLPMQLRLLELPGRPPNAMALPDGTIVMTDAMVVYVLAGKQELDATMRAQLSGILAHEIGHVEARHSMRIFARSALVAMGSGAMFGDFSAVAAGAPALLKNLEYSRAMESDADSYALARLQALGIPSAPLADLFDALAASAPSDSKLPRWMRTGSSYVSSHPASAQRSAHFRHGSMRP